MWVLEMNLGPLQEQKVLFNHRATLQTFTVAFIHSIINFCNRVSLAGLELTMSTRLVSNSGSAYPCPQSAGKHTH